MDEQWQLYNEQGEPISNAGALKEDIFNKGLLHGASHVWVWRIADNVPEVLFQKRSATKETWPNLYDISAAGHIDLGENQLIAALREASEEIGIEIASSDLSLISVERVYMTTDNGKIENEFQWIYLYRMDGDFDFNLQLEEVESLQWQSLEDFKKAIESEPDRYVPHGTLYFSTVIDAIEFRLANNSHQA